MVLLTRIVLFVEYPLGIFMSYLIKLLKRTSWIEGLIPEMNVAEN